MVSAFAYAADLIKPPNDTWIPHPHQIPPAGDWFIWLLLGGRGSGKTAAASRHIHEHVYGPPCLRGVPGGHWPGIIAPTLGDAVTSCVNGPSGLRTHDPGVKVSQNAGGTIVKWSNGVEAKLFGAHTPDDVERLRSGGNRCVIWAEELAAWRYIEEAWQHMRYGLRVGPNPHVVASTTPRAKSLIKKLFRAGLSGEKTEEMGRVALTRATTDDNPDLPAHIRAMLYADYKNTRLGRQELYGEILEDVEGALWTGALIESTRLDPRLAPEGFDIIIVAVDPPAKSTGDECGITVHGRINNYMAKADDPISRLPHGFLLADYSRQGTPGEWANECLRAYNDWGASYFVAEINNGGDMVKNTIHGVEPSVQVREVHASKGKAKRAEPVVNLYEQGRYHHVGMLPMVEDQMTTWDSVEPPDDWSPDRMDSLVWGATQLLIGRTVMTSGGVKDSRLTGRR